MRARRRSASHPRARRSSGCHQAGALGVGAHGRRGARARRPPPRAAVVDLGCSAGSLRAIARHRPPSATPREPSRSKPRRPRRQWWPLSALHAAREALLKKPVRLSVGRSGSFDFRVTAQALNRSAYCSAGGVEGRPRVRPGNHARFPIPPGPRIACRRDSRSRMTRGTRRPFTTSASESSTQATSESLL